MSAEAPGSPALPTERDRRTIWGWFRDTYVRFPEPSSDLPYPHPTDRDDARSLVLEFWKKSFESPDKARARAQAGFTIVSTLGAAFVGSAILTRFTDQNPTAKVLAFATSVVWIIALNCYLSAATRAPLGGKVHKGKPESRSVTGGTLDLIWQERSRKVIALTQNERSELVWRLRRANNAAMLMIALAILSLAATFILPVNNRQVANVTLNPEGIAFFVGFCKEFSSPAKMHLDLKDLEKNYVQLTEVANCPPLQKITVRRDWITVVSMGGD